MPADRAEHAISMRSCGLPLPRSFCVGMVKCMQCTHMLVPLPLAWLGENLGMQRCEPHVSAARPRNPPEVCDLQPQPATANLCTIHYAVSSACTVNARVHLLAAARASS